MEELFEIHESHKVIGHIYKIINNINNKCYIGQTRSHRLNKGKYRPFGYIGRFKDHISEAKNINKKNRCTYLNNAIIKYGVDNFTCELIITCPIDELDKHEINYISLYNSKFPNGYNLTDGGQKLGNKKGQINNVNDTRDIEQISKMKTKKEHSDYTRSLISRRLNEYNENNPNICLERMYMTQKQHYNQKFEKCKNSLIDRTNIDQYIKIVKNNILNYEYVRVRLGKQKINFVGKHETIDEIKNRARMFILDILKWQDNLDAGTPLEPLLPLSSRNVTEELG